MLSNKLALITGAASGIGRGIAEEFAKKGADLILVDVSEVVFAVSKSILNANSVKASTHICDVADPEQVLALFEDIRKQWSGRVANIIVNAAGVCFKVQPLVDMSYAEIARTIDVDYRGTVLVCQAAARALIVQFEAEKLEGSNLTTFASIINFSSVNGKYARTNFSVYSGTKAAIDCFTKAIAKELGFPYRIRCNSIQPGAILTPMVGTETEALAFTNESTALRRMGFPIDMAALALFLASDASSFITGEAIEVSGGVFGI